MALSATIYRFDIDLSHLDRHIYRHLSLRLALHPSETPSRMLCRVLAYCWCADEKLEFTKGLSTDTEPDIWSKTLQGEVAHWVEVGLPTVKRTRQAHARAETVTIFAYGGQGAMHWWRSVEREFGNLSNLSVWYLEQEHLLALERDLQRSMSLSCIIEGDDVQLSWAEGNLDTSLKLLKQGGS